MFRLEIAEPGDIEDDALLGGDSIDLDSLDQLELCICIEEQFGISIGRGEETRVAFGSISRLAEFIDVRTRAGTGQRAAAAELPAGGASGLLPAGSFAVGTAAY
jgi:acyl carrier protein